MARGMFAKHLRELDKLLTGFDSLVYRQLKKANEWVEDHLPEAKEEKIKRHSRNLSKWQAMKRRGLRKTGN